MSKLVRTIPVAVVATLTLAASASAGAAVTIGQLAPETSSNCRGTVDRVQGPVTSGNTYVVPGTGTITSWSHNAKPVAGQQLTMKVFRPLGGASYMVVGHDGPRGLTGGTVNTFPANVAVKAGDVVGLNTANASTILPNACLFDASLGDSHGLRTGSLADGESGIFEFFPGTRVNVSAVFEPSNSFTLGKAKLNKKKGTATLTVNVPNPGELTGSGKGVKVASAAVISKTVSPGNVKLTIKAKGKKKATLNETGKVNVKPKITYTPTGGSPSTQAKKLKLKKTL
jgi:hypothetical protein